MTRLFHRTHKAVALSPGTVLYHGPQKVDAVRIRYLDYDKDQLDERKVESTDECLPLRDTPTTSWINIDGLHDEAVISSMGEQYGLHPLILEDIVNTHQRPKLEDHGDYIYVVMRMLYLDEGETRVTSEQFSFVLGRNYVLSFQERYGDVFEPVRERLRLGKGRSRKLGPDYLAYALMDAIVDNYFAVLEKLGEKIESLEDDLIADPMPEHLHTIHGLKREMIYLRKAVWPLRECIGGLERSESDLVKKATVPFLRDLYDHTIQVIDAVESFRDMLSSMQDLYLSSVSNRMNEVMKVLTVIATIFVPLTFVAGIYGMNFEHMPELGWKWSYLIFWIAIVGIGGGMVTYFKRSRWF